MEKFTANFGTYKGYNTYDHVSNAVHTRVTRHTIMYQIQTSPNIKTGFTSLESTYSISFYLINKAYLMK
jgi:hypothetical protein